MAVPRNRKERRASEKNKAIDTVDDIPLSMPSRSGIKVQSLYDIAAARQSELQNGQPFTPRSPSSNDPSIVTATINSDGSITTDERSNPELDEPVGPLGQAIFYAVTLIMLHFTLDVLVHQQYRQSIDWGMIAFRTVTTFPALIVVIYVLHPRADALWAQMAFLTMSVVAGCYMVHSSNKDAYFAVMKRAPPLGTLWVWSVIEMRLAFAVLSVVGVGGYFWWGGYTMF